MQSVKEEKINKELKDQETWNFNLGKDGIYLISITARCKNWQQNWKRLFNDDDLGVQVDDYLFAEVKGKKREFTNAGSWNGNELKDLSKKAFFILPLKAGEHRIKFWADGQPYLEEVDIYLLDEKETVLTATDILSIKNTDIIVKNLAIEGIEVNIKADVDSKLELKIDGKTQLNQKYQRYKKWYWYGRELLGKAREFKLDNCWVSGVHSLEFRGEGKPEIESLKFKIGGDRIRYKMGRVKLWKDITPADVVNLRSSPSDGDSEIVVQLRDGDEVEIINERILGGYVGNLLSEVWHEAIFQDKKGFILSSFVEIEGQEREKLIDLIKDKCREYNIDANIMLAIAARESHFKPFVRSVEYRYGIFQLGPGAIKDVKIADPYDFLQNIDGGVRYYKAIEERFTGRGDILKWRLIAWHDGPTITGKKKTINYDELSPEANNFLKNVLANYRKRDWYHIISLSILFFAIISVSSFWRMASKDATAIENFSSYMPQSASVQQLAGNQAIAAGGSDTLNEIKGFPAVFWDEKTDELVFTHSKEKEVARIDAGRLNLDQIFEMPVDFAGASGRNLVFIEPTVLENPENIFYFAAANSYSCGANNCAFVLFRFNASVNKLEIIDRNISGAAIKFYLSPNKNKLAYIIGVHGGSVCAGGDHLVIVDLANFKKRQVDDYLDWSFDSVRIEELAWKNNESIELGVVYTKCADYNAKRAVWLYNNYEQKIEKIKSDDYKLNMSG